MIIEIPNENSIIKWKNDEKDEWKYAEISDLIKAYKRPQGDLISREVLRKAVTEATYNFEQIPIRVDKVQEIIDNAPTVERPQGEWILNKDENPECPFCHHSFSYWGNFCGNCGADMR